MLACDSPPIHTHIHARSQQTERGGCRRRAPAASSGGRWVREYVHAHRPLVMHGVAPPLREPGPPPDRYCPPLRCHAGLLVPMLSTALLVVAVFSRYVTPRIALGLTASHTVNRRARSTHRIHSRISQRLVAAHHAHHALVGGADRRLLGPVAVEHGTTPASTLS